MIEINGCKFNKINEKDVDWFKNNLHLKWVDVCKGTGISDETARRLLKALGIKRERHWKRYLPNDEEAMADLLNPYMSHVKIAEKYGVHETTVGHRRKELGVGVRRNMAPTRLEEAIEQLLVELDYAYVPQKMINQWSIDFYMGQKTCIDVHGEWAHTRKGMPERDNRKRKELEAMGYRYLVIHESELDQAKQAIEAFMHSGFPLSAMTC